MAKDQVLCVLVLLAAIYQTSNAWWFINKHWQTKNCFCQVLLNNGPKTLVHDMGSIYSCKELFGCGCSHYKMKSCLANCEDEVKRWAHTSCPSGMIGQQIRAKYKASNCHNGLTGAFIVCSGNTGTSGSTGGGGGGVIASSGGGRGGESVSVSDRRGGGSVKVPVDHDSVDPRAIGELTNDRIRADPDPIIEQRGA
ncbi:hypothetical protein SNE40_012587 [Patella caerulea]|uniref:Uncharacterized protein n=1 Tax=Patella caerulea TaxID=87958 RepID=A0AAN8JP74_PATCE